jgi:hypothetical protein
MGHSPSLQDTINKSEDAKKAVQQAVANAVTALKNDKVAAETYINSNSKGIVKVVSEIFASYSKFSDEYNLKGVDASVDAITKTATDYFGQAHKDDKDIIPFVEDLGGLVKTTLALAATSSSTSTSVSYVFNQFRSGLDNYATYYACNSMTVSAQNVWGNKDIIVVANAYILAQVQPDPEIERVESLQNALDDLEKAENRYNDALANVTSEAQFESLSFYKDIIEQLKANVQSLMKQAIANRLKGET